MGYFHMSLHTHYIECMYKLLASGHQDRSSSSRYVDGGHYSVRSYIVGRTNKYCAVRRPMSSVSISSAMALLRPVELTNDRTNERTYMCGVCIMIIIIIYAKVVVEG